MNRSSLLCKSLFLSLWVGNTLSFSTTSLSRHYSPWIIALRSSPTDDDNDDATIMNPRPPEFSPMVDEQLQQDLMQSERRILMYEAEIGMVREQLDLKQEDLQEERNRFRGEKSSLLEKIADFSTLLSQRDEELEEKELQEPQSPEQLEKVNELIDQVKTLSGDLDAKTKNYLTEKETTKELRKRFEVAQDTLEFEQMRFEKEKKSLQDTIDEEKKSLKSMADKMKQAQESFDSTKKGLIDKIKSEEENFIRSKQSWSKTQAMVEAVELELRESLKQKEEKVAQSDKARKSEKDALGSELKELREKLVQEQDKATRTVYELIQEKKKFEQEKKNLEAIVKQEQKEIEKLQGGLLKEEEKFEKERMQVEQKLSQETEKLKEIEAELAGERDSFSKEKERMQQQVEQEIRVRQLKKRSMNERYTEIRREMTELWENSKRQARKEEARLKNKYDRKLADVKKNVLLLEGKLEESDSNTAQLTARLNEARRKNEELVIKTEKLEDNYKTLLSNRDVMINHQSTVIEEQKKTIDGYESSFRLLAQLSLRVTGRKIKNVGGTLSRFLQSSPKDEADDDVSEFE